MIACMPFIFPLLINSKYNGAFNQIPILILGAVFNVVVCLYSAVYIAKKMTKQVATVSIIGAIINITINVLFIKYIGVYAASISTAISYFAMMLYRHIDLKKYVNIKYESGLIVKTFLIFTFSIILYYQKNMILNIINLIVVVIYAFIMNKDFLSSGKKLFLSKFGRK